MLTVIALILDFFAILRSVVYLRNFQMSVVVVATSVFPRPFLPLPPSSKGHGACDPEVWQHIHQHVMKYVKYFWQQIHQHVLKYVQYFWQKFHQQTLKCLWFFSLDRARGVVWFHMKNKFMLTSVVDSRCYGDDVMISFRNASLLIWLCEES